MAQVIAMYGMPSDTGAFERYCFEQHVCFAETVTV